MIIYLLQASAAFGRAEMCVTMVSTTMFFLYTLQKQKGCFNQLGLSQLHLHYQAMCIQADQLKNNYPVTITQGTWLNCLPLCLKLETSIVVNLSACKYIA